MRIALFNIDSVTSNSSTRAFIEEFRHQIVFVGLSPPFRPARGGLMTQAWRHLARSGLRFMLMLHFNFALPRFVGAIAPRSATIEGLCRLNAIPIEAVQDVNDPAFVRRLAALDVDLIVSSFFDQIFRSEIIALPRLGVVNVHISKLPSHRGPMPVVFSCLDSPAEFAVSLHLVDDTIDTGPVLAHAEIAAPARATVLALMRTLQSRGMAMLPKVIADIEAGRISPSLQTGGSYESFPDRKAICEVYRRGYRLFGWRDIIRAIRTPASI